MKTHVGSHRANKDMQQNVIADTSATELERPDLYLNREQSWIEFNRRVFQEAQNSHHPLLERVKFLSIFDSNLQSQPQPGSRDYRHRTRRTTLCSCEGSTFTAAPAACTCFIG